jgi:hypothetical protein
MAIVDVLRTWEKMVAEVWMTEVSEPQEGAGAQEALQHGHQGGLA